MGTFITILMVVAFFVIPLFKSKGEVQQAPINTPQGGQQNYPENDFESYEDEEFEKSSETDEPFLYKEDYITTKNEKQNIKTATEPTIKAVSEEKREFDLREAIRYSVILDNPYINRD